MYQKLLVLLLAGVTVAMVGFVGNRVFYGAPAVIFPLEEKKPPGVILLPPEIEEEEESPPVLIEEGIRIYEVYDGAAA